MTTVLCFGVSNDLEEFLNSYQKITILSCKEAVNFDHLFNLNPNVIIADIEVIDDFNGDGKLVSTIPIIKENCVLVDGSFGPEVIIYSDTHSVEECKKVFREFGIDIPSNRIFAGHIPFEQIAILF